MSAYRKEGATVDDMGLLRTTIEVENLDRRGPARSLPDTLVDTGSEYTWIPRDVLKGLRIIVERKQGFVVADKIPRHERDRVRQDLLDYCQRDTWAMVRLVERLRELARVG